MILVIGLSRDPTICHTLAALEYNNSDFTFFELEKYYESGYYFWDSSKNKGYFGNEDLKVFPNIEHYSGIYCRLIDTSFRFKGKIKQERVIRANALSYILQRAEINIINKPGHEITNSSKMYHLNLLKKCGFNIPDSLLTNNKSFALEFINKHKRVIYKGCSSEKTIVTEYKSNEERRLDKLKSSPVLFQEYIEGADVRTHFINDSFFSEDILSESIDYRFDNTKKLFSKSDIPVEVKDNCVKYAIQSGLKFIGFDFKKDLNGTYFILEANPMPGYESYDRRLNMEISSELIRNLKTTTNRVDCSAHF